MKNKLKIFLILFLILIIVLVSILYVRNNKVDKTELLIQSYNSDSTVLNQLEYDYEVINPDSDYSAIVISSMVNGKNADFYYMSDNYYKIYYYGLVHLSTQVEIRVSLDSNKFTVYMSYPADQPWCDYSLDTFEAIPDKIQYASTDHTLDNAKIKRYIDVDTMKEIIATGNAIQQDIFKLVD